ncbi:amidohydrolase [Acetonema longum]|uniref:5-methylthioadenosine/S-adenosylhomocysteine deaminase n=1 Tax=Acetonema longum DSM 6540 TaxID=1009370 RepID=F7NPB1_9FIRM|nr:amidohydrolase [Acetonema longum]EGO62073.1 amidohydrolase [Acetonema longum DSM 6540]
MTKLLLKGGEVLLPNGQVKQADVAIENNVIAYVDDIPQTWQPEKTIHCSDKLIAPGLVNTHTHAAMTLFRSYADDMALMDWLQKKIWPAEAKLVAQDVYWGTMLAIAEMLKSGTTTFADMYFFMDEVAKAVDQSGIRAVLSRGMSGVTPTAQQALTESEEFFRTFHGFADGRITVMLGPHAPYTCPPDYLKKVISLAEKLGAQIHIHLSETEGEVLDCLKAYGKSPIALMEELGLLGHGVLAAHCVHVSAEDIAIMQRHKVRVAHNPGSNMKLASGVAPVPAMLAAGLPVGLGTDGASSNNNLDMLEELRLAALLHKVHELNPLLVPAKTAVDMATAMGAQAVGLEDAIGSIQKGFKADLVIWNMHNLRWCPRHDRISLLTYSASAQDVHTVIVNGHIVVDNQKLVTIDEEKLLFEVQQRGMRLVRDR